MNIESYTTADAVVAGFLANNDLPTSTPTDCPYLPDRLACSEGFTIDGPMDGAVYRALMDRGFRRSGQVFYRPHCPGCQRCIPIRVPVASFAPTRSMRRIWRRNMDVTVTAEAAIPTDEKHALFGRYLAAQHDGMMTSDRTSFESFLYDPVIERVDFCYRLGRRLVGVSMADRVPGALSSVYMCFDPAEQRRSLGTYSVLWELEHCREQDMRHYYLGYYIQGSRTMSYKARFQPSEILDATGRWVAADQLTAEPD